MSYLLVYQKGTTENDDTRIITRTSADAGYGSWSAERVILTASAGEAVKGPNIVKLSDGRLLFVYNRITIAPAARLGIYYRLSSDSGVTWGAENQVDIAGYTDEAEGGPIIELADGRWCCPWWATAGGGGDVGVIYSANDGATWVDQTLVGDGSADGRNYLEANVVELANDDYLMSIRESVSEEIWLSTYDHVAGTWSAPATSGIAGKSAARMRQLSTGKIVMVYRREDDGDKTAIATSDNNGAAWNAPKTLLHDAAECTYGGIVELSGDWIAVAYGSKWSATDGSIHVDIIAFADLP